MFGGRAYCSFFRWKIAKQGTKVSSSRRSLLNDGRTNVWLPHHLCPNSTICVHGNCTNDGAFLFHAHRVSVTGRCGWAEHPLSRVVTTFCTHRVTHPRESGKLEQSAADMLLKSPQGWLACTRRFQINWKKMREKSRAWVACCVTFSYLLPSRLCEDCRVFHWCKTTSRFSSWKQGQFGSSKDIHLLYKSVGEETQGRRLPCLESWEWECFSEVNYNFQNLVSGKLADDCKNVQVSNLRSFVKLNVKSHQQKYHDCHVIVWLRVVNVSATVIVRQEALYKWAISSSTRPK